MGPKSYRWMHARLLLASVLLLIGFGAMTSPVAAQDDAEATSEAPVDDLATPEAGSGEDGGAAAEDDAEAAAGSDVANLPDTGTGSGEGSTGIVLTASALVAATLGLTAIGLRRFRMRNDT